jgi:DNA invertase Pin-like site-specific DNA recombinase
VRLIGYVRVSRVAGREGASFISPKEQRERIEAQAKAGGHTLVDILQDLDEPGSKYERPHFQEALERVESGEADGIIVYALDRFARSSTDAGLALRRLDEVGGRLISVRDNLDTSTPVGRFARDMMLRIAELQLDQIRENWDVVRARTIERGVHISRVPPVGYLRGKDGRLEPDPVTAPVVREVFRRRAAATPWRELCRYLDEQLPRPEGGVWPVSSVTAIVSRRTYLGEAAAGDIVNRAAHPPLVSLAEWQAAQAKVTPRAARNGEGALLAGIIVCAGCGKPMTREGSGAKGPWQNYACRKRHANGGACPEPTKVSTRRADALVEAAFLDWLQTQRIQLAAAPITDDVRAAEEELERAEAELAAYRDAELVSVVGREVYLDGLRVRAETVGRARSTLAGCQAARSADGLLRADLGEVWPDLSIGERRHILSAALDRVEVKRGRVPVDERIVLVWRDTP